MQNSVAPGTASSNAAPRPATKKRKRRAKAITWTVVGAFVFCLAVMGVSAFVAKSAVDTLVAEAKALVTDIDDSAKTNQHVDELVAAASRAHWATAHPIWRATEVLPMVGDDLRAVRLLARTADSLMSDVAAPLLEFDLSSIGPVDGALNVDAVAELGKKIEAVAPAAQEAQIRLLADGIETEHLLEPLRGPVTQVEDILNTASDVLRRVAVLSPRLPAMLGADTPQNYLVLVQNTAEMRTLGGNPGSMMMLTIDKGRMDITQTASQADVNSARAEPIVPLNPWTEALYTDRVGRYLQDTTMTPDFAQTAYLARAFWSETLGDPGNSVISIDPVLLSYIMKATGPVELPDGTTLSSDNVVDQLLSKVYERFPLNYGPDPKMQDAFFAAASGSIFGKLMSAQTDLFGLIRQLSKGYAEGRILYAPTDAVEAKAISNTLFNGPLHDTSNRENTTLGVFVNDNTEGKLDYYTDMSVAASSNVCTVGDDDDKTYTVEATYSYNLMPEQVATLPIYVSTGRYFERGLKSTNLVFYGPIGSTFVSATLDGTDFVPQAGTNDLGRQAVLINFESEPSSTHTVEVIFSSPPGIYGPIDVRTTPMITSVPVSVDSPSCG
ncbi:DUF4012 domain-containing protein [Microbacterium gubbeenense]|uniref:DUF4012 domain-containing protein n=1 Tax=Microbacterium gubbeenense TaxID=159896 RepID=UPI003F9B728E